MKKILLICALAAFASGCATVGWEHKIGPGFVFNSYTEGEAATSHAEGTKTGRSCIGNYLGFAAAGDGSVEAAKKDGGITKVATVSYEVFSVLTLYARTCTVVTGS